ncbi:DnaB-like helicase N-terminal domain-containing protein, partial [Neisseria sp. SLRRB23]|uniref:DnaB-like helicase N-terminal domain-containing protein n=1 Tax=Neisseria sp. SLRRB23 TaxID=3435199 RepID=UPI003D7F7B58
MYGRLKNPLETAPEAAKPRVEAVPKNNGFIPNLIGVLANAPEALAVLEARGEAENAGGLAYLIDLNQNTPSAKNISRYVGIVNDRFCLLYT